MEIPDWKPAGRRYLLLFLLLALALGGAGWYVLQETPEPELVLTVEETGREHRGQTGASGQIEVYISGAVKKPGVYDVPAGSRVYDLVRAAGDVISYADMEAVNLSAPLADGDFIHIPLAPDRTAVTEHPMVNINTAGLAELESLPGIGEVTARKILDYREEHGLFREKRELLDVPSIGEGRYAKIEDRVTL